MADLARMPALLTCRRVMGVVDSVAPSGFVDASNPSAVVVRFPIPATGSSGEIVEAAILSLGAAGFDLVRNGSDARRADLVVARRMAA